MIDAFLAACGWCRRAGIVLLVVGFASVAWTLALAQSPGGEPGGSQLWAQLLNAGIVIVVGGAAIGLFLRFKDKAIEQAGLDREAAKLALQEAKDGITRQIAESDRKLDRLNFALLGLDGESGILAETKLDQRRRHDLGNQIIRMGERLHDITELLASICHRLQIPFDHRLHDEINSEPRKGGS